MPNRALTVPRAAGEAEVNGRKVQREADRVFGYQYEIDPGPRAYTVGGGTTRPGAAGWPA